MYLQLEVFRHHFLRPRFRLGLETHSEKAIWCRHLHWSKGRGFLRVGVWLLCGFDPIAICIKVGYYHLASPLMGCRRSENPKNWSLFHLVFGLLWGDTEAQATLPHPKKEGVTNSSVLVPRESLWNGVYSLAKGHLEGQSFFGS